MININLRLQCQEEEMEKNKDLMKQFSIETEAWRFRENVTRALKLVKKQWPECNVVIKDNAMVILPTRTQIQ